MLYLPMNVLQFRWSPVHLAAYYGQLQAVTVLLQRYNCQPDQKERVRSVHNVYLHVNVKWWKCINQLKWDFGNIPSLNVSVQWSATLSELWYIYDRLHGGTVGLLTYILLCLHSTTGPHSLLLHGKDTEMLWNTCWMSSIAVRQWQML